MGHTSTPADRRRALTFVTVALTLEGSLYGVLAPQLVAYTERFGLSDPQAGVLTGAYTAGMFPGVALVMIFGARLRPRRVMVAGLALLAVSSIAFGLSGDVLMLFAARSLQGLAAGLCYPGATAWLVQGVPTDRQGGLLGATWGAITAGSVVGPALGALATQVGSVAVFVGFGCAFTVLGVVGAVLDGPSGVPDGPDRAIDGGRARGWRALLRAASALVVPALALGLFNTLGPLHLDRLGAGSTEVAVYFLVSAVIGAGLSPSVGALADRMGGTRVLRVGLVLTAVVTAGVPFVDLPIIVGAGLVLQLGLVDVLIAVPTLVLVSRAADHAGRPTVTAALVACVYAVFETAGAVAAPVLAQVATFLPFTVVAVTALLCLAVPTGQPRS